MLYARSVALARNVVIPAKIPHFSSNKVKFRKKKLWTQGSEWDLRNNRRHWNRFIIYRELRMRAAFKYWGKSDYKFN